MPPGPVLRVREGRDAGPRGAPDVGAPPFAALGTAEGWTAGTTAESSGPISVTSGGLVGGAVTLALGTSDADGAGAEGLLTATAAGSERPIEIETTSTTAMQKLNVATPTTASRRSVT